MNYAMQSNFILSSTFNKIAFISLWWGGERDTEAFYPFYHLQLLEWSKLFNCRSSLLLSSSSHLPKYSFLYQQQLRDTKLMRFLYCMSKIMGSWKNWHWEFHIKGEYQTLAYSKNFCTSTSQLPSLFRNWQKALQRESTITETINTSECFVVDFRS